MWNNASQFQCILETIGKQYVKCAFVNVPRPSAKLLQSKISTQLESSEHSDTSDELPPTPPDQLLKAAKSKANNYMQDPPAQRVTSYTSEQYTSPSARQVDSFTPQRVASHASQQGTRSLAQCIASPTAQGASPTCEAMFTKLLTILEEVKETQHVHGKMLNVLLKKQDGSVVEVPEGVVLPLKTQADLEALDQKLGDHTVMSAVVSSHLRLILLLIFI